MEMIDDEMSTMIMTELKIRLTRRRTWCRLRWYWFMFLIAIQLDDANRFIRMNVSFLKLNERIGRVLKRIGNIRIPLEIHRWVNEDLLAHIKHVSNIIDGELGQVKSMK